MAVPGYPIVLTADRTLTARYDLLFDGMLAASTTTTTPGPLANGLLLPEKRSSDGRSARAPLGLRRIEAALLKSGFSAAEVVIASERQLASAIGPATRVIGISSGEPMGRGMNSSTMTAIAGGSILPQNRFEQLMASVRRLARDRAPGAKIVMGGPGAWQISDEECAAAGVDHVFYGYAEDNVGEIFKSLLRGGAQPWRIEGKGAAAQDVPSIHAPSTMGAIEISRGCGLGCHFCTMAKQPMMHLPPGVILADIEANVRGGQDNLSLLSEDFFRYGGRGLRANPAALIDLLHQVRAVPGIGLLQIDHANLCSVAQFADAELATIRDLLAGSRPHDFVWVNVGVETASGRLLKEHGGAAKLGGCETSGWDAFSAAQVRRLIAAGYFPFVSLILGLPGESREDVARTLEWVGGFRDERLAIFPVLYAPLDGGPAPGPRDLSQAHWTLLRECYRLNFEWIPRLYWDNQAAAGVPLARRLLMRLLGTGQIAQWWFLLRMNLWRSGRPR